MKSNSIELELGSFSVTSAKEGNRTCLVDGVLYLNVPELRQLLLQDHLFRDVQISIVHPGDNIRIVHVVDVVEPRVRISAPGTDFPGFLAPPSTVGEGRTHRLNGVAVVEVSEPVPGEPTYWREAVIDMTGVGAQYSPFAATINIVIQFIPNLDLFGGDARPLNLFEGTPKASDYNRAVRLAGLKASVYLAKVTQVTSPDTVDHLWLEDLSASDLPRITYLYQTTSPYVYGEVMPSGGAFGGPVQLPIVVHPTEVLDGAFVNSWNGVACMRDVTWLMQNHAIIRELYRHHGQDLNFNGVVAYTNGDSEKSKERLSSYAAHVARNLRADGAVLNYCGGGHPGVDVMMVCAKLEKQGIKTVLLANEMASRPDESGFVHFEPEANAIVSTGNYEQVIDLPAVSQVVGGRYILVSGQDACQPIRLPLSVFVGSTNQFGASRLSGRQY